MDQFTLPGLMSKRGEPSFCLVGGLRGGVPPDFYPHQLSLVEEILQTRSSTSLRNAFGVQGGARLFPHRVRFSPGSFPTCSLTHCVFFPATRNRFSAGFSLPIRSGIREKDGVRGSILTGEHGNLHVAVNYIGVSCTVEKHSESNERISRTD